MVGMIVAFLLVVSAPGAELDAQIAALSSRLDALEATSHVVTGSIAASVAAIQSECLEGCVIRIAPGVYDLEDTVRIVVPHATVDAHGVTLRAPNIPAVVLERSATGATWSGGSIVGVGTSSTAQPLAVAFTLRGGRQTVERVDVDAMVRGVQIIGSPGITERAQQEALGFDVGAPHANQWRLIDVVVGGSWLDGVYISGSDANAGVAVGIDVVHSCWRATYWFEPPQDYHWPAFPTCANIQDRSFLGNTWVAPHSSAAYAQDGTRFFQYLSDSLNARSTWLGAYAEAGSADTPQNGPSHLRGAGHISVGGIFDVDVPNGLRIGAGGRMSRARFQGSSGELDLCLGECDQTGSPFVLERVGMPGAVRAVPHPDGLRMMGGTGDGDGFGVMSLDMRPLGEWRSTARTLLPACTSTTGVTWSSPSGLVVREDGDGMSLCDGSE